MTELLAYYLMSIIFQNKKMKVERAIGLFDSLISPIALYAFQFWSVLSLPASSFNTMENLLNSRGKFLPETLNQKCCRLILSVQKKTSNEISSYNESHIDCWLNRINKVESLCKIPYLKSFSRIEKVKNTHKTKRSQYLIVST